MKIWAEKKRGEMKVLGATELAEMFDLVVRICELDEELAIKRNKILFSTAPKQFSTPAELGIEMGWN